MTYVCDSLCDTVCDTHTMRVCVCIIDIKKYDVQHMCVCVCECVRVCACAYYYMQRCVLIFV